MKKILLTICFAVISLSMFAVKALTFPTTVLQPDGSKLTVLLHGDENINWYTTDDGVLLVREGNSYYVANVTSAGQLTATKQLAHDFAFRSPEESKLVKAQNKTDFAKYAEPLLGQGGSSSLIKPNFGDNNTKGLKRVALKQDKTLFPHVGSPKALVILVEFSDTTFSLPNPRASFYDYLNNEDGNIVERGNGESLNYKGVRGYFKDASFGKFTPKFDIVGPVKLQHPLSYYGAKDDMTLLIPDACKAVDDSVDFSNYDANGDGYVDLVYIIYAGHSESQAGNSSIDIWPRSGWDNFGSFDGKQVYRYGVNNELNGSDSDPRKLINGIGLFCHEFSHTMGYPDIYATSGSKGYNADNFGMEYWDLMDGGEYVHNGRYPTAYTAWEREIAGWVDVTTLSDTTHVVMENMDNGGDLAKAYKIVNPNDDKEAFYLQNIQNVGWNTNLPSSRIKAHGLFVYRVSYASEDVNIFDRPNNGVKPRIIPIAADGSVLAQANATSGEAYYNDIAGDTYPGTTGTTDITSFTTYDGTTLDKPILNIAESDNVISFDFLGTKGTTDGINKITGDVEIKDSKIYSITGQYLGTDASILPRGIYIINHKKIVVGI